MEEKVILILVTDLYSGYGDFLFALKLLAAIRQQYADIGQKIPCIYIVTTRAGERRIKQINGDVEFQTEILTLKTLNNKIKSDGMIVDQMIESPVFDNEFITEINKIVEPCSLFKKKPIPLIMITEYGLNSDINRLDIQDCINFRQNSLSNIKFKDIIYSGFKSSVGEFGILISKEFANPTNTEEVWGTQLDDKIKNILFIDDKTLADYQQDTDLFFQYSNDLEGDGLVAAEHFLHIHRELSKTSPKNQDIIMVGNAVGLKISSLNNILDTLINTGSIKRIIFFNCDTQNETTLYDATESNGKIYRVIYTHAMSHQSMLACIALSNPVIGVTGDQSLGEAISAGKTIVYETIKHKKQLISNYDDALLCMSSFRLPMKELLKLLRSSINTPADYAQLGKLLLQYSQTFKAINQRLAHRFDLTKPVMEALQFEVIIANLLGKGQQAEALAFLLKQPRRTIFERYEGKSLLQHAQENNIDGAFSMYFKENPSALLLQYILSGQKREAEDLMLSGAAGPFSIVHTRNIFEHCIDLQQFSFAKFIIEKMCTDNQYIQLGQALYSRTTLGNRYLESIRQQDRDPMQQSSCHAIYIALLSQILLYEQSEPTPRYAEQSLAFIEMIKLFHDLSGFELEALIGLLLLILSKNTPYDIRILQQINSNFDPDLYHFIYKILLFIGIDIQQICTDKKLVYLDSMNAIIQANPKITANTELFRLLSEKLNFNFPSQQPLIKPRKAKEILTTKTNPNQTAAYSVMTNNFTNGFYIKVDESLNCGGWGSVYLVRQYTLIEDILNISQPMAMKVIQYNGGPNNEISCFQQVYPDGHYDQWLESNYLYLVMPLFAGIRLDTYLKQHDELSQPERYTIIRELFKNLKHIHQQGVTHNDLKPQNMLWDPVQKQMKIIDFGCAERMGASMKYESIQTAKFAIEYMPPEYIAGTQADPSADIYSLPLILIEILGLSSKDIVFRRAEKVLQRMQNKRFEEKMTELFIKHDKLDNVLFCKDIASDEWMPAMSEFIINFIHESYDFSMYLDTLGEYLIGFLDQMQSQDPTKRPSIDLCIEQFIATDSQDELEDEVFIMPPTFQTTAI